MTPRMMIVALVLVLAVGLGGCAGNGYYSPERSAGAGALGGAATGAALGAIIGAATGSPATGAWVGAAAGSVVGAVGGYLYAQHQNTQIAASQAAQSYTPDQGNMVQIDRVDVTPGKARAGQQVDLVISYTLMTPENAATQVRVVREVRRNGVLVAQPHQAPVTHNNGTFVDQVAFNLPANAAPGTYVVVSRVMSERGAAERETYFIVE